MDTLEEEILLKGSRLQSSHVLFLDVDGVLLSTQEQATLGKGAAIKSSDEVTALMKLCRETDCDIVVSSKDCVYAHNDARRVRDFCAHALDADAVVALEDRLGDERKKPLPAQLSVVQLLTHVPALFGRLKRRLFELQSLVAMDDTERLKLAQSGGQEQLRKRARPSSRASTTPGRTRPCWRG